MHISTETLPRFDGSQIRGTESEDEERLCTGHTHKTQVNDRCVMAISSDRQKLEFHVKNKNKNQLFSSQEAKVGAFFKLSDVSFHRQ